MEDREAALHSLVRKIMDVLIFGLGEIMLDIKIFIKNMRHKIFVKNIKKKLGINIIAKNEPYYCRNKKIINDCNCSVIVKSE